MLCFAPMPPPKVQRSRLLIYILFGFIMSLAVAKPTLPFSLPESLHGLPTTFQTIKQQIIEQRSVNNMKSYNGKRLRPDTLLMIYHHDATAVIAELGAEKLLLSCQIIEIQSEKTGKALLETLSAINRPLEISLDKMFHLMDQCNEVDRQRSSAANAGANSATNGIQLVPLNATESSISERDIYKRFPSNIFPRDAFPLLSGIIPGTKWCGTGDIAESYDDLGIEVEMDRCCRNHDLCPVKIKSFEQKYELSNESIYTKSHCHCDEQFFACLKAVDNAKSQLTGSIYFNLVQVPCLAGNTGNYSYRPASLHF